VCVPVFRDLRFVVRKQRPLSWLFSALGFNPSAFVSHE
jgi:hypothetical protein